LLLNHYLLKLLLLKERTQENLRPILIQPLQQQGIEIASIRADFCQKIDWRFIRAKQGID